MPSRKALSEMMKGAGYSVPNDKADAMTNCLDGLWHQGGTVEQAESCEREVMGNKHVPGSVAANFASKWSD